MKKIILIFLLFPVFAVSVDAQNNAFQIFFQGAQSLYNQGEYEKALEALKSIKLPDGEMPPQGQDKIDSLKSECNRAIAIKYRLTLESNSLSFNYEGGCDSLSFEADKRVQVTASSSSPWCVVEGVSNGQIYIRTEPNLHKEERTAKVTVRIAKSKNAKRFTVSQNGRLQTNKRIVISTSPEKAQVSIDDEQETYPTRYAGTIKSGRHQIHIKKSGYFDKDTTITVEDNMRNDTLNVFVKLTPKYGKIALNIIPEEGFTFGQTSPICTINGRTISQLYYSYNDARDIEQAYYSVHQDGTIPVPAGTMILSVSAEHFQPVHETITVAANNTAEVSIVLKAKSGELTLTDMSGNASVATVILDGKPIGKVQDITRFPILEGEHSIKLEKAGYLSTENDYSIDIHKGESLTIPVSMVRYAEYIFTSTPGDARVYINGTFIDDTTPTKPYILRETSPGQAYKIEIKKDNYLPISREITPDYASSEIQIEHANLIPSSPFKITSDEDKLRVTVKNKRYGDSTIVDHAPVPAEFALPIRKKSYYVEMDRLVGYDSQKHENKYKPAYKGYFRFNDPAKDSRYIQSWSKSNFQILSVNYYINGTSVPIAPAVNNSANYRFLGNANLMNFKLFTGLSTSVVRTAFFMGDKKELTVPISGKDSEVSNPMLLPAFSIILINGDFRIGGAICDYVDVNALVSYAWYPDVFKKFVGFSHFTGHDLFIGGELSSRIPVFNVNIKMGVQMYPNLKAHFYGENTVNTSDVSENYVTKTIEIPAAFVISAGFTLGGKRSKGNNLIRLF